MPNGTKSYKVGNDVYDIPLEKSSSFLKQYPNAIEVQSYTVDKDTFDIPVQKTPDFLKAYPQAKPIGFDSKEVQNVGLTSFTQATRGGNGSVQQQGNGHSDKWNQMQTDMAKKAKDAGLPHFDNGNDRLKDAINRSEKAGYKFNHFTDNNDPTGDRAVSIDIENLTKALQKRLAAETNPASKAAVAKELSFWQSELKDGMTAQEWENQTGEADPIPQSSLRNTLKNYSATHQQSKNASLGYDVGFVPKGANGGDIITAKEKSEEEKLNKAAANTFNKTIGKGSHTQADSVNYVNQLKEGVKKGDLGITQDAQGNDVIKNSGNLSQSFKAKADQAYAQDIENKYLRSISKDEAISYLNRINQNPETGIVKELDVAPEQISGAIGEQSQLLGKTIVGSMAGAETGLTGGASAGSFLTIANDLANSGYSQALKKNYFELKKEGLSDDEAFDKATHAALVGEAVSLGTGALLSGEINMKLKPNVSTEGFVNSFKHTIKSAPKVIGSAGVGSVVNDIETNSIANGNPIDAKKMWEDSKEAMQPMAIMHTVLGGLAAISNGQKTIVPSYVRPQMENIAASADRGAVEQYYRKGEEAGIFPEGTTDKVLNKLTEFDNHKKVVENLPISEERKAAITGKLIQRDKLKERADVLSKYGASFNSQIEDIGKKSENIEADINDLVKGDPIEKVERDEITGEKLLQPKKFEQLTPQEKSGIEVPKEYGKTVIEEVGEGEEKRFVPKAYVIEEKGGLKPRTEIEVTDKKFKDKADAQAAADKALSQHYYENGLHDNRKPHQRETKEAKEPIETTPVGDKSGDELKPTETTGITETTPDKMGEGTPEKIIPTTENPKSNSIVDKGSVSDDESRVHAENIKNKFREVFKAKGNSDEHIDAAIALMDARAKSWASEENGRKPEQWYRQIADVKNGEFETGDVQYQGGKLKSAIIGAAMLHSVEAKAPTSKINISENKPKVEVVSEPTIKIKDDRKIDAVNGGEILDNKKMSGEANITTVKEIVQAANKHKVDPYTMLAIAYQETKLEGNGDTEWNPFHLIDNSADDLIDEGVKLFNEKMKIADSRNKQSEADRIQAFNGYGKVGKSTEGIHKSFYGIDVSKEPLDMNKNPVYGKRIVDIRDNIIKKNPELVKLVEGEKRNAVFSGVKDYNTKLTSEENTKYEAWKSKLPKELQNDYDYDLKGLWKDNPNQQPSGNMHFPDKYKKPNHYTFSDESKYSNDTEQGGKWEEVNGKWIFRASDFNLTQHSKSDLLNYFKKYEPDSKLILPDNANISYQKQGDIKRGALETLKDGKVVIHALNAPDISTMTHEIFHVFEKDLTDTEKSQVKDFGGSEAFARAGERYLREGKAPTKELQLLFEKFKTWLTNIYQSLKGSPIAKKITPEIREIFDRLLSENESPEIKKINIERNKAIDEVAKPEIKLSLISGKDLANAKEPLETKRKHTKIKERYKKLRQAADCIG